MGTLLLYSILIVIASVGGGVLTQRLKVTHLGMQLMMSLVGGLILGVAILHMLPHAIAAAPEHLDSIVISTLLGVLGMLLLMRLFHVHQHQSDEQGLEPGVDCDHPDHHHHDNPVPTNSLRWMGLGLGMVVHSLLDGIAVASYVVADQHGHEHEGFHLPGLGIFVAIMMHKPLDASSIVWLMKSGKWSKKAILTVNAVFALTTPLGAWLFYAGLMQFEGIGDNLLAYALGFSAGVFLCISLSDILPEVQFHSHDRAKLTAALLAGVGLAWSIGLLEPKHAHSMHHGHESTTGESEEAHDHNHDHDSDAHDHEGHDH